MDERARPLVVSLETALARADLAAERRICRLTGQSFRPDPTTLPLDCGLASALKARLAQGGEVILIGALPGRDLALIAARLGQEEMRLISAPSGPERLQLLRQRIGDRAFALAGSERELRRAAAENLPPPRRALRLADLALALRPHHWIKNLLLLLPLLAAHRWAEPLLWGAVALIFLAFCAGSSAIYLLNDLCDIEDDRHHPRKRLRPLASGRMRPAQALMAALILLLSALALAAYAGALGYLALYCLGALAYSLKGKTIVVIDLFLLTGLYLIRLQAGGAVTAISPSDWLMALCGLTFLSLVCAKRCAELTLLAKDGPLGCQRRGYLLEDRSLLTASGIAAAVATQVVLLLYLREAPMAELYSHPAALLVAGLILLSWLMRIWLLVGRGRMPLDPVVYALRDRSSFAALAGCAICLAIAIG